jgi:hypothetical protein
MKRTTLVIAFTLASGLIVQSQTKNTGNSLFGACGYAIASTDGTPKPPSSNETEAGFCVGYVGGMLDGFRIWRKTNVEARLLTAPTAPCIPDDVTYGQAVRVVSKYMNDHPEILNEHSSFVVLLAFQQAWPCKK